MLSRNEKIHKLLLAADVKRCHVVQHQGEYTVGRHSFNALLLLFELFPGEPPMELVKGLMYHDVPELILGDLPATAKWYNEMLSVEYAKAEARIFADFGIADPASLSDGLYGWLDGVDKLELYIWAMKQQWLGNTSTEINDVMYELCGWFERNADRLPDEVLDYFEEIK